MNEYEVNQVLDDYLDLREVFQEYGYQVNRAGFCCCPFHMERTPSCRVDKTKYHCFGCDERGNALSFIKKLFNLDFKTAIQKLNDDFRLGLLNTELSPQKQREITQKRIYKYEDELKKSDAEELHDKYFEAWRIYVTLMPPVVKYDVNTDELLVDEWFNNLDKRWIEALDTINEFEDFAYINGYSIDLDEALCMFTQ